MTLARGSRLWTPGAERALGVGAGERKGRRPTPRADSPKPKADNYLKKIQQPIAPTTVIDSPHASSLL
jgi:hypothetical protein